MKKLQTRICVAIVFLLLQPLLSHRTSLFAQTGPLTSYVIGTFDLREGNTKIHILNPTGRGLWIKVGFFSTKGDALACRQDILNANGVWELDVMSVYTSKELKGVRFGVVKVVSFNSKKEPIEVGIVANARYIKGGGISETQLHPIPYDILKEDLKNFMKACK
jgi:hypothetical protein